MDAISASHLSFIRLKLASGQAISAFKFSISAKVYWKHWQRWYLIWPKNDSMSIWYTCPPLLNTPSMGVIDNNENRKAKEQTASTVRSLLYSLKVIEAPNDYSDRPTVIYKVIKCLRSDQPSMRWKAKLALVPEMTIFSAMKHSHQGCPTSGEHSLCRLFITYTVGNT